MSGPCAALATVLAVGPPSAPVDGGCLGLGVDAAGRFGQTWPAGGIDRQFTLPRARAALGVARQGAGARVVMGAVRSGGESGYIGVQGESIVPRVEVAEASYRHRPWGLAVAAGLVDDLWVVPNNTAWSLRSIAPGAAEARGWMARSDLGGVVAWTSPQAWVTAAGALTAGEGLSRRERNGDQDVTGSLVVRPLSGGAHPDALALSILGRDGSWGLGRVRDHRLGARITGAFPGVGLGVEALQAWGVQGDDTLEPWLLSGWAWARPEDFPLAGYGRLDRVAWTEDTTEQTVGLGLGAGLADGLASVWVGWEWQTWQAEARAIAGADALAETNALFLQLDVHLNEGIDTDALSIGGPP